MLCQSLSFSSSLRALTELIAESHCYSSGNCSKYHPSPISKPIYPKDKEGQSVQCPSHPQPSPGCLRTLIRLSFSQVTALTIQVHQMLTQPYKLVELST